MLASAARFTCAADEVWRLQRGSDADCVLFQRWSNGGERITDRGSRQGFWVFAPGGELLGRVNTRNVDAVLATLDSALERWNELPEAGRHLPDGVALDPEHRWEHGYPEDGLALERISRDVDPAGLKAAPSARWNRDTLWCSADEVRAMLPAEAEVGDLISLALLAERLSRFALVDDARGQTLPYAPEEVGLSVLVAQVVGKEGAVLELQLSGWSQARSDKQWLLGENLWTPKRGFDHGMTCELIGRARVEAGRFHEFELVAVGQRQGRTQFNGRGQDLGPSLVGFHFTIAPESLRLPPAFAALYGVDWIPAPALATWRLSPAECGLEDE